MAYPFLQHPFSRVPGVPGDNLHYIWKLWWFKYSLLDLHRSPFFAPQVMYPNGYPLALDEMTPSFTLLGVPLTALLGPTAAYSLLVWLSFPVAGIGMYLLAAQHGRDRWACFIAGLIFAFAPSHFGHAFGHLNLMGIAWAPFLLWATERTIATRRLTWAAAAGGFYALTALSSWYLAVIFGLGLLIYAPLRARAEGRSLRSPAAQWAIAVFALVALVPIAPFLQEYLRVTQTEHLVHPAGEAERWSASLADFFVPNPWHPLWGPALRTAMPRRGNWDETALTAGYTALLLAVLGWRRRRPNRAYLAVGAVGLVLALGPTLHVLQPSLGLPLPGRLLAELPFLRLMRATARFGALTLLATAGLAGFGFARLTENLGRRRRAVAGIAVSALVLFEFLAVPPMTTSTVPDPADRWLARQPGEFTVVWVPSRESWNAQHLLGSATHGKNLYGGFGTFLPATWLPFYGLLDRFPDPELVDFLVRECGVRYALVRPERYGPRWPETAEAIKRSPQLRLVHQADGTLIYELRSRGG